MRSLGAFGMLPSSRVDSSLEEIAGRVRNLIGREVLSPVDIDRDLPSFVLREAPLLGRVECEAVVNQVRSELQGFGSLHEFVNDPTISDVLVHGDGHVWIERDGILQQTDKTIAASELLRVVERALAPLGRRIDRSSPIVEARLADGARLHAVIPPIAVDGPIVAIRRFRPAGIALEAYGSEFSERLRQSVKQRRTILVSGGTGAGKTTVLNALAGEIPHHERVVTIEDAAELAVPHPHVVRLESRPANSDGIGALGLEDLVRTALRLRPDRIILGEVRGAEVVQMLTAMSTGHAGSLSTVHANSAAEALHRLETLVLWSGVHVPLAAVREQINAAIDIVVHVVRAATGQRSIETIADVALCEGRWVTHSWS